ncbi:MAG: hypothetical protein U0271_18175 [Polyangiaceae bacterium]
MSTVKVNRTLSRRVLLRAAAGLAATSVAPGCAFKPAKESVVAKRGEVQRIVDMSLSDDSAYLALVLDPPELVLYDALSLQVMRVLADVATPVSCDFAPEGIVSVLRGAPDTTSKTSVRLDPLDDEPGGVLEQFMTDISRVRVARRGRYAALVDAQNAQVVDILQPGNAPLLTSNRVQSPGWAKLNDDASLMLELSPRGELFVTHVSSQRFERVAPDAQVTDAAFADGSERVIFTTAKGVASYDIAATRTDPLLPDQAGLVFIAVAATGRIVFAEAAGVAVFDSTGFRRRDVDFEGSTVRGVEVDVGGRRIYVWAERGVWVFDGASLEPAGVIRSTYVDVPKRPG